MKTTPSPEIDCPQFFVVIPAAGIGQRFANTNQPKQYQRIGNETVLSYAMKPFLNHPSCEKLVLVHAKDDPQAHQYDNDQKVLTALGGAERADSVLAGLDALAGHAKPDDWVLVHDAARPCLSSSDLQQLLTTLKNHPVGGLLAEPVSDTIKLLGVDQHIEQTIPRETLCRAQTPQMFRFELLKNAILEYKDEITDESQAMEKAGHLPQIVFSTKPNPKITYPGDLAVAASYLTHSSKTQEHNMRIGFGTDTHRYSAEGKPLRLAGIEIPYRQGILAHSDGDVVIHAISDALLGALALGDIGQHFPDTDPAYENMSGEALLKAVYQKVREQEYSLENLDATITAQQPKLAPHIPAMQGQLAAWLDCELTQISIKATTPEKLDALGREEGLMCEVIALLKRKNGR